MKKLNKLISFTIIATFLLSFVACGVTKDSFKLEKRPPFLISQVYNKQWASGIRDGSVGDDVYVSIEKFKRRDADITFQQLFFKDQVANLRKPAEYRNQFLESSNHFVAFFKDGNTNEAFQTETDEEPESLPLTQFPFELTDTEAVISYEYFGRTRYYKIPFVKTVSRIGYPSMNMDDQEKTPVEESEEQIDQK